MKTIVNYSVCSVAILIGIMLVCSGDLFGAFCGVIWFAVLYITADYFRATWRKFWRTNLRILAQWGIN